MDMVSQGTLEAGTRAFYSRVLEALATAGIPYLVGAGYAFAHYTGIAPHTKDLDAFVRPRDKERALAALSAAGYRVEGVFHWIGKVYHGEDCVDVICSTANGVATVDDAWFAHAVAGQVLDRPVELCPVEEIIWTKAFLMERERYDGADVAHLLLAQGPSLDWTRLLQRFGRHGRVLLSHLVLFGFIYPTERDRIPGWVMRDLLGRLQNELQHEAQNELQHEAESAPPAERLCQGTLLSWRQYLTDVEQCGYQDARISEGYLTQEDVTRWTEAFRDK